AGPRVGQRPLDRLAAVEHDLERSLRYLRGYCRRILGARVVGRDDRAVGQRAGDPAHERPLLAVAVSSGTEDDGEPAAELACCAQDVLERIGRVRVVDDDRERLSGLDGLEAPGDARERFDAFSDRVLWDVE